MTEPAAFLLVGVLFVQLPLALVMYLDAKRLNLKNPQKYWFGVTVPAAGFVVILYYFSARKDLPKKDPEDT
ncbi:hypothetical protein [Haloferax sp. YSMS24]|uniref:hypothetical protein n=1 Tax=Haloferax sp. YSMS24 TaxID=3388425 RepID=UPI00398D070D